MTHIVPADDRKPEADRNEHLKLDQMLDIALTLTFPGSDPVAITIATNHASDSDEMKKASLRTVARPTGSHSKFRALSKSRRSH